MTPKSMQVQCRVLLELADSGKALKSEELQKLTGLDIDQVTGALTALLRKQKIRRVYADPNRKTTRGSQYLYQYSEDEPLPNVVGHRGRPSKAAIKADAVRACNLVRLHVVEEKPKLIRVKIRLLERLLDMLRGEDRDVMLGILADYQVMNRRKVA